VTAPVFGDDLGVDTLTRRLASDLPEVADSIGNVAP